MDYGFAWFTRGPLANSDSLRQIATTGESLGYSHIVVPDHVVIPVTIDSTYPYSADGSFPGTANGECMDTLVALSFIAAMTSRLRLLTSVMVVPHRPALLTAKMVATIDRLSGGRMTLGCGAGWMEEEFEALELPPYAERGAVTDEYIEVFRKVWSAPTVSHAGKYVNFRNVSVLPNPVQKPGVPIWTGGESAPALRRAVRVGDGWYPIGNNPRFPMDTHARIAGRLDRLKGIADEEGRDLATLDLAYWSHWYNPGEEVRNKDGDRMILTGSADTIANDIGEMKRQGFGNLMLNFTTGSAGETTDRMAAFMADVAPRVT